MKSISPVTRSLASRWGMVLNPIPILGYGVLFSLGAISAPTAAQEPNPPVGLSEVSFSVPATPAAPRDTVAELGLLFGWPREMIGDQPLGNRTVTLFDFDGNEDWEVSALTTEGRLYAYQHDGANYPGFPREPYFGDRLDSWERSGHPSTAAVADINGDGKGDLVYTSDIGYLHVMREEGTEPPLFPYEFGRGIVAGMPALAFLDGDLEAEIVFHTSPAEPESDDYTSLLHIISPSGEPFAGWPIEYPRGSTCPPAVGDLNYDGQWEIVIANAASLDSAAHLYVWRQDGLRLEGFPVGSFETVGGAPVLADLNGDHHLEILIWAVEFGGGTAGVYAFDDSGTLLDRFPLRTQTGHPDGGPVVGNIGADQRTEIVFGSYDPADGAEIYAWNSDGRPLNNFPIAVDAPAVVGTVILADVSGDGENDIVAALAPNGNTPGSIAAWYGTGQMVDGFPISLADYDGGAFAGPPSIADVNRDGFLELAAVTTDRRVLIWETPGFLTNWDWWPTLRGGVMRTGVRPVDDPTAVREPISGSPVSFGVEAFPNPFNANTRLRLNLPRAGALTVDLYDLRGRLLKPLYNGMAGAGAMSLSLELGGMSLPAGAYLCRVQSGANQTALPIHYLP